MKNNDINIRDPFILYENGLYYMYGTRADSFGIQTGGFDVYLSRDLSEWSEPKQVFYSEKFGLNSSSNWAPEVHRFNGRYYLLATFEQPNGNRGTYSLVCDTPDGEFVLNSETALTPPNWMSLDGTLYVENNTPYLVFCHEHVQIHNGTVCFVKLSGDLSYPIGEPVYMFSGSNAYGLAKRDDGRYVTDGPFVYSGKNGRLYIIWSTFFPSGYAQCIAVSSNGKIDGNWLQLPPVFLQDGGHGMLFTKSDNELMLVLHSPNESYKERPVFFAVEDTGETIKLK